MSIHIPSNPEIEAKLAAQKRNVTITSIIIALLISALLVGILWMISLSAIFKNTEELVTYSSQSETAEEITKPEMTNEVMKKPSSPSSSLSKVIASTTPSPTSVPVPDITVTEPSLDFGDGDDFGDGWGNGGGNGSGSAGGGISTPFGKTGGDGLKGSFYDLKQTPEKTLSKLGKAYSERGGRAGKYKDEIEDLNRSKYSESRLSKFYKANLELTFSHMVMKSISADEAPKAFGVEKEVEPAGWIIVYEGKMEKDAPNKVKFVGRYDDLLLVFVNNRLIFDGSWTSHSREFAKGEELPGPSIVVPKMRRSDKFVSLNKGDSLRIVIGESPGGLVGGGIFVEEEGKKYEKNSDDQNILPPFATQALDAAQIRKLKAISYPIETRDIPIFSIK